MLKEAGLVMTRCCSVVQAGLGDKMLYILNILGLLKERVSGAGAVIGEDGARVTFGNMSGDLFNLVRSSSW